MFTCEHCATNLCIPRCNRCMDSGYASLNCALGITAWLTIPWRTLTWKATCILCAVRRSFAINEIVVDNVVPNVNSCVLPYDYTAAPGLTH